MSPKKLCMTLFHLPDEFSVCQLHWLLYSSDELPYEAAKRNQDTLLLTYHLKPYKKNLKNITEMYKK